MKPAVFAKGRRIWQGRDQGGPSKVYMPFWGRATLQKMSASAPTYATSTRLRKPSDVANRKRVLMRFGTLAG